ncbi:Protein FASN-1 [Aphelenchoides avenae]|nr:Protein FASN-1 [Aphelenchus avenae]
MDEWDDFITSISEPVPTDADEFEGILDSSPPEPPTVLDHAMLGQIDDAAEALVERWIALGGPEATRESITDADSLRTFTNSLYTDDPFDRAFLLPFGTQLLELFFQVLDEFPVQTAATNVETPPGSDDEDDSDSDDSDKENRKPARTTTTIQQTLGNTQMGNAQSSLLGERSNQRANLTVHKKCSTGHCRSVLLINRDNDAKPLVDIQKVPITETDPVWFVYSGMGSQWPGMAEKLMRISFFDNSLRESSNALEEFGLDVYEMLCNSDPAQYKKNTMNCMLAFTAIQNALSDTLRELRVVSEGIVGHSTGEMGCGYANGALTRDQTMMLSLMAAILRRSLHKTCTNGLVNMKAEDELESFILLYISAVGKIYQAGATIHLKNLYPHASMPAPVGTPMIAPMWCWDLSQDWPVVDGRLAGQGGGVQVPASASYTIDPFAADSKEAFLLDHVIDGRVLYPFTSHIVLAWKTLCKLKGVDFQKAPVILENINVYNATISTKPIRLDVTITPGPGAFEILDGDQLAASGRIYIPDENKSFYYENLQQIETSKIADRIELDTEDAYKEFLLGGYEYGQAFRGIYRTCNRGERGTLYWTGNWNADSLRLPIRVRYLRIDPTKHLEYVEERDGIQVVELRNDVATNGCVAGGVECCDLTAHTVQRRMQNTGQLYLEKLFFVKHVDDQALSEFPKEKQALIVYRNALIASIRDGLKAWQKAGLLDKLQNGKHFKKALEKISARHKELNDADYKKLLEDSKCTLVTAVDEIFSDIDTSLEPKAFEEHVVNKMSTVYKSFDIDRYWAAAMLSERLLKTRQDVCIENSASHINKFCRVELTSTEQIKHCVNEMSSHPLLVIDWNCVGPNVEDLDENTLSQIGVNKYELNLDDEEFKNHNETKNYDYLLLDRVLCKKKDPVAFLKRCSELLRDDCLAIINEVHGDPEIALLVDGLLGVDVDNDAIIDTDVCNQ